MSNSIDTALTTLNVLLGALDLATNLGVEVNRVVALQQQAAAEGRGVSDDEIDTLMADWLAELNRIDSSDPPAPE